MTYTNIDENYLLYLITSLKPYFLSQGAGAAQPNISREKIVNTISPLPPLPEQHRIVARIDQLMARCDALETLRKQREEKRLAVHTAAIKQLLEAKDGAAWDFIQQHFGELYTVKENVTELRKAILQLAVMGRLVPQDPNDPPASELLKEIEAEKQRLVKEGKIKKPKPLPPIKPEEVPYELPQGWEWVRLGDISLSSDSGWSPQCLSEKRSHNQWGVLKVSAVSWRRFNPDENKALPPDKSPRPECEVKVGDFLLSRANTAELVARSVIVEDTPRKLMMSDKIVRFDLSKHVNKYFINIANGSDFSRSYYMSNASGTSSSMKNVSRQVMAELPIPLPPLPEQHRIVARVDQLMALCDTLEQQIDAATNKQTELLNAVMVQV
jgi:type I restriction enzyme S subunit